MIDYEKIYVDSYSEYYCKAETLIKKFLMKRKSEERGFGKTSQKVKEYLTAKQKDKYNLLENRKLIEIYELFGTRYQEYEVNHIQNIFAKKIKIAFENIETSKLPLNYSYSKLIKEIAVIEVLKEISRLMTNNNRLLELFYDLNMFDEFEIREHRNISLENYPIYKKLNMIKYPNYYNSYSENEIFEQDKYEEIDLSNSPATEKIIFLQKLGVIDFLRTKQPFSTSINSLATVLSAVTGEKSGTVQPMLNAMLSKNVDTRNNPLESKKPVNKVTQQLIKIGFNLNETI